VSSVEERRDACLNAIDELLCYLRRQQDSDIARELNARFDSPGAILEAGAHELSKTSLTANEARLLALMPPLVRSIERTAWGSHPRLDSARACTRYLSTLFIGMPCERFYALSLDGTGLLTAVTLLGQGTLDETPFYLGALLKGAVETDARCMVLSHNHPGGTLQPSRADIDCTKQAQQALQKLGITLVDHIIVADGMGVSLRQNGFIDISPEQDARLCVDWLK